jgi:uncharacterized membrane protein
MSSATSQEGSQISQEQALEQESPAEIDALSFAGAAAVVSGLVMVILGVLGSVGVYEGGVEMMEAWHLFFEPTLVGTVAGVVEAAVSVFVLTYLFVVLYNSFSSRRSTSR